MKLAIGQKFLRLKHFNYILEIIKLNDLTKIAKTKQYYDPLIFNYDYVEATYEFLNSSGNFYI